MTCKYILVACILLGNPGLSQAEEASQSAQQPEVVITQDMLDEWTAYGRSLRNKTGQRGLGLATSATPFAAQLLITAPGTTRPDMCSGALIGPSTILTAAHCFCGLPDSPVPDYAAYCQAEADDRQVTAHISMAGIFDGTGNVVIHPQYVHSNYAGTGVNDFADLALVFMPPGTSLPPPVSPYEGALQETGFVAVGFGHLAFATAPPHIPIASKQVYLPGLEQVTPHNAPGAGVACSPNVNQSDALCIRYDAGPKFAAGVDEGSVCTGDSGGPLLVRDASNPLQLIGVASYYWPPSMDCSAEITTVGVYTDVRPHVDWINAELAGHQSPPTPASGMGTCFETSVGGPGAVVTEGEFAFASVRSTAPKYQGHYSAIELSIGDTGNCVTVPQAGFATCTGQDAGQVHLKLFEESLAQLVVCRKETSP